MALNVEIFLLSPYSGVLTLLEDNGIPPPTIKPLVILT